MKNGLYEHTVCPKGLNIKITSKHGRLDNIRLIPKGNHIILETVYTVSDQELLEDNGNYAAIDLGINNMIAVLSNTGWVELINGRPIKSINQYYNKKKAILQSLLPKGVFTSNQIRELTLKRNNKIEWELHNISKYVMNQLVSKNINTLIIGQNKGWKQDIKLGKRNNQNFVTIPYSKLIQQLQYKCQQAGITVILTEESYTSKCSFLDKEKVGKHEKYLGKRVRRGLYVSSNGKKFNADINGAGNILRKVVPDTIVYSKGIEGFAISPVVMTVPMSRRPIKLTKVTSWHNNK